MKTFSGSSRFAIASACVLALISGCRKSKPAGPEVTTYVVKGTVLQADGKPMPRGFIEFQPVKDGKANGRGMIESGEFTLTMMLNGTKYDGVPAGQYRVIVTPFDDSQDQQNIPQPIQLKKPVTVEAKEGITLKLKLPK